MWEIHDFWKGFQRLCSSLHLGCQFLSISRYDFPSARPLDQSYVQMPANHQTCCLTYRWTNLIRNLKILLVIHATQLCHQNLLNQVDPGFSLVELPTMWPPNPLPMSPTTAFKWIILSFCMCSVCATSTSFLWVIPHRFFKIILWALQNIVYWPNKHRFFSQNGNTNHNIPRH